MTTTTSRVYVSQRRRYADSGNSPSVKETLKLIVWWAFERRRQMHVSETNAHLRRDIGIDMEGLPKRHR